MRLPVATQLVTRDGSLSKDALMVNALAEAKGESTIAFKRPGLRLQLVGFSHNTGGIAQGMAEWKGKLYSVDGNTVQQWAPADLGAPLPFNLNSPTATLAGAAWSGVADQVVDATRVVPTSDNELWAFLFGGDGRWYAKKTTDGDNWTNVGDFLTSAFTLAGGTFKVLHEGVVLDANTLAPDVQFVELAGTWYAFAAYTIFGVPSLGPPQNNYHNGETRNAIFSSADGLNWSLLALNPLGGENGINARQFAKVISHDGSLMIVGGAYGEYQDSNPVVGGTKVTTVYRQTTATSANGTSWAESAISGLPSSDRFYAVYAAGPDGVLYAPGEAVGGVQSKAVFKSTDGVSWDSVVSPSVFADTEIRAFASYSAVNRVYGAQLSPPAVDGKTIYSAPSATPDAWEPFKATGAAFPIVRLYEFAGNFYGMMVNETNDGLAIHKLLGPVSQTVDNTHALTGAATPPDYVDMIGNGPSAGTEYLFIKTPTKAWTLTFGDPGTLAPVTDADYPANTVPGAVYLDGYICVMDAEGTIFNSGLEDPTSWNSLDFVRAEAESDPGVAIGKHMNYIVAFKQRTLEFFYDAANETGSPFSRLPSAAQKIGCGHGRSLAEVDGGLFFLSRTSSAAPSVHRLEKGGLNPVEVATEDVKRFLAKADLTSVLAWAARLGGHTLYVLGLLSEDVTLVYDLTSSYWSIFTRRTSTPARTVTALTQENGIAFAACAGHGFEDGDQIVIAGATPAGYNKTINVNVADADQFTYPVDSALTSPASGTITATGTTVGGFPLFNLAACLGRNFVQDNTSTDIYEIDPDYLDDDGDYIDVKIREQKLDTDTIKPKTMASLVAIGEESTGALLVRWSDDDYRTYAPYRSIDLEASRPETRNMGRFRRRALEFRYTGTGAPRLAAVEIELAG